MKSVTVAGTAKKGSVTLADGVTAVSSNGTLQTSSSSGTLRASAYSDSDTISLGDLAKYELHVPGETSNFHAYVTAQIDSISYAFEDVSLSGIKSASVKLNSHIALHSDGKVSFDKTIPLMNLNIPLKAGLVVTGSVDLVLHADGSYEITYTIKNVSGLEYPNSSGQISPVCETTASLDKAEADANAKAGARFIPCLKWSPLATIGSEIPSWLSDGLKDVELDLVTFNFEAGIEGTATAKVYDDGKKPITCTDLNLFDYESLSGKVGDDKIWSKEFLKQDFSKKALDKNFHFEDGKKVESCTRKITSITRLSPAKENVTMKVGETADFKVKQLPEKLTTEAAKVAWSSSKKSVATVSSDGTVSALKAGKTTIKAENVKTGMSVSWTVTVKEKEAGWSVAYKKFVLKEEFLNAGQDYADEAGRNDNGEYKFALHDIDADDIPELVAYNGYEGRIPSDWYIYGCKGSSVIYLGEMAPWSYGKPSYIKEKTDYPGLFFAAGGGGATITSYYSIENESIIETEIQRDVYGETEFITSDSKLLAAFKKAEPLKCVTLDNLKKMGWEAFVKSQGY